MSADVPARFSRQAMSAIAIAQPANAIGMTPVKSDFSPDDSAAMAKPMIASDASGKAAMVVRASVAAERKSDARGVNATSFSPIHTKSRANGFAIRLKRPIQLRRAFSFGTARTRAGSKRWKKTRASPGNDSGQIVETKRVKSAAALICSPRNTIRLLCTSNVDEPIDIAFVLRSEERRVGKECRSRW